MSSFKDFGAFILLNALVFFVIFFLLFLCGSHIGPPLAAVMVGALCPVGPGRSPAATALGLPVAVVVLVLVLSGGADGQPCPAQCSCTGTTVDCHGQGLRSVPRNIPRNTERL